MEHNEYFAHILVLLAWTVATIGIFQRISLPPILGYLFVGAVIGPNAIGFIPSFNEMEFLAEFGVVFLMFTLGLEFSLARLMAMKRTLLGVGGLQVFLCTSAAMFLGWEFAGLTLPVAFVLAATLALSSTAVVIKQLTEQNELTTEYGRLSISILLFQDIAAVIFLVIIPALQPESTSSIPLALFISLSKGLGVFSLLALTGNWVLRPLFHEIAKAHSRELFMITALLVALSAAWFTEYMGLSMAFGAFTAGLMLGETEFKHQLEIDIRPFKDVLLGLFFITIGSRLDLKNLQSWDDIVLVLIILIFLKGVLIFSVSRLIAKQSTLNSIKTSLILAQGGELGFLILTVAITNDVIDIEQQQTIISALVLSLVIAPLVIRYNHQLAKFLYPKTKEKSMKLAKSQKILDKTSELDNHIIICGYGRIGQVLYRFLSKENIPCIALDLDPMRISKSSQAGENCFYGDARDPNILAASGLAKARMVVISFSNESSSLETLYHIRSLRLDLPVFVRTKDDSNLKVFQNAGATEVVPESLESSLMLSAHLLLSLGLPTSKIVGQIREVYSKKYSILQGFFEGLDDEALKTDKIESSHKSLHTVTVTDAAYAVGKTIKQVLGDSLGSEDEDLIKSLTRQGSKLDKFDDSTVIEKGDVFVFHTTLENLSRLEDNILRGST